MEKLVGPFRDIIPKLIKYKKSLGHKYNTINNYVMLDRYLFNEGIKDLRDTKKIYEILITNTTGYRKRANYFCLKELYAFMKILGYKNLYMEELYFENESSEKATILTNKGIIELFNEIDELCKRINNVVYPVLFRLIYSCGLRPGEIIKLKTSDISLDNGTIKIMQSKNNKTRILPLSKSMFTIIKHYLSKKEVKENVYLFEINNKKLTSQMINSFLDTICIDIRLYDFRHTFAVHTLNKLFSGDVKSSEALYPLSVYMGHSNIKSTEYYLQFTKEYYKDVIKKIDKHYKQEISKNGGNHGSDI